MAYFLLPQYCSDRPESLLENLKLGPKAGATFFYVMTCHANELEPREDVIHDLSVNIGELNDTVNYYIVSYPTPPDVSLPDLDAENIFEIMKDVVLAPYFSAVLENRETHELDYFILGQSSDGFTSLRSVNINMNANLGRGCEPELNAFIELLRIKNVAG